MRPLSMMLQRASRAEKHAVDERRNREHPAYNRARPASPWIL